MIDQILKLTSIFNSLSLGYGKLILIYISLIIAFTIRVVTGFGSAMLLSPILSMLLMPKEAVVLALLFESAINSVFSVKEKLVFTLKEVYMGAFSGIVAGIFLFGILSQRFIGIVIGLSMTLISISLLKGLNFYIQAEGIFFYLLGFVSGSMGVLTGVNGPQLVLGMVNQRYNPDKIRTFIITYFVVIDTLTLIAFILFGHVNLRILILFLSSIPFIYLSYLLGIRILKHMNSVLLHRVILYIVLLSSLSLLAESIGLF